MSPWVFIAIEVDKIVILVVLAKMDLMRKSCLPVSEATKKSVFFDCFMDNSISHMQVTNLQFN